MILNLDGGGWIPSDDGVWQLGKPASGPYRAYEGNFCIGTNLNGAYPKGTIASVDSPPIALPRLNSENEKLYLNFYSWHSYDWKDFGSVWIRIVDQPWRQLDILFYNESELWTSVRIDITEYAGKPVIFQFVHVAHGTSNPESGWYVDLIQLLQGVIVQNDQQEFIPWKQVAVNGPEPCRESAMAFDSTLNEVVVFGGFDGINRFGTTWSWNGQSWLKHDIPGPSVRSGATMAYDSTRDVVVLFGGTSGKMLSDTWEFDGDKWTQISPSQNPPARSNASMVYDQANQQMILFGGSNGLNTFGDTWAFDGSDWTQLSNDGPSPRSESGLVYDTQGRVILFGGGDIGNFFNDTWIWTDNEWVNLDTTNSPSARKCAYGLVFDSKRNMTYLFGGVDDTSTLGDTWEFDGITWKKIGKDGPLERTGFSMAYDSNRDKVVLFGGANPYISIEAIGDTWEYQPGDTLTPNWIITLDNEEDYTRIPGGFLGYSPGSTEIGTIPEVEGYSDGRGLIITAAPNQVETILCPTFDVSDYKVLIRVTIQATAPGAEVALAALDGSMDGSIGTNIPANSEILLDGYHQMTLSYEPTSGSVVPVIQLANLNNTEPVTIYVDNIEIIMLPHETFRSFYDK
jgi:hypothetical protein